MDANEVRFREAVARLGPVTLAAVEAVYSLSDVPGIRVEFGAGKDLSMLVKVPLVSKGTAFIVLIDSTGRLMLNGQYHGDKRVIRTLEGIAQHGRIPLGEKWPNTKPTALRGTWEISTNALTAGMRALARGEDGADAALTAGAFSLESKSRLPAEPPQAARTSPSPPQASQGAALPAASSPPEAVPPAEPAATSGVPAPKGSGGGDDSLSDIDLEAARRDPRIRVMMSRWLRANSGPFRDALLKAYGATCCLTGHGPSSVLQAAHIEPHSQSSDNSLSNGLLLRADLHILFDAGLLRIHPETLQVELDESLRSTPYADLHGRTLRSPAQGMPCRARLAARWAAE